MNISDCLDKEVCDGFYSPTKFYSEKIKELSAKTLDEQELLVSISKLLYKTKSVRGAINLIDRINQCTDIQEVYGLPTTKLIFGFDHTKPIAMYHVLDPRDNGIKHNLFGMKDDNSIKILDKAKNNIK